MVPAQSTDVFLTMGQTPLKPVGPQPPPQRKAYPEIITVFSKEYCEHDRERGGLFLLPVISNDGAFEDASAPAAEPFSPLLLLPLEILYQIVELAYYDENSVSIPANLEKFLKTVPVLLKTFNQLALRFLYKYAIFNRPHSFDRFLRNIVKQPDIGQYVEFMDFQTFTSIGLGRTGRMNQEIQMVTSSTIRHALDLCPNLIEFMASENIQDDMDVLVLSALFALPRLQAVDFCGASSRHFADAFSALVLSEPVSVLKLLFHDCSNLAPAVFEKILPRFPNLRRLDLTHTLVTLPILHEHVPKSCALTHLSLARCLKLTTKALIQFLTTHPAVTGEALQWLNLQIDSNVVLPLNALYLFYTLNHLKAPALRYLNLGGMPVNSKMLLLLRSKFAQLESLVISHTPHIEMADLVTFLQENDQLRFLDVTGCKALNRRTVVPFLKACFDSALEALEFDYNVLWDLTGGTHVRVEPVQTDFTVLETPRPQLWKFFDNEGRRAWIYKIGPEDPQYELLLAGGRAPAAAGANMVFYDLETGAKIETRTQKPGFLKYALRKINCLIGYHNLKLAKKKAYIKGTMPELVWPVELSQRGIYNYYLLNVK